MGASAGVTHRRELFGFWWRDLSILGGAIPSQGGNSGHSEGLYGTGDSVPYEKAVITHPLNDRVLALLLSRPPKQLASF